MQQHTPPLKALLRAYAVIAIRRPLRAAPIAYWWITRRRVRARLRFNDAIASLPDHYRIWLSLYQSGSGSAHTASLPARDGAARGLALHLHVREGQIDAAIRALAAVRDQLTRQDTLYVSASGGLIRDALSLSASDDRIHVLSDAIATPAEALRQVLELTEASHLVPIDAEAEVTPGTIEVYARAIATDPAQRTIFYADQDERDGRNLRNNPWLKPGWDEDLFLAQDYISAASAIPVAAARRIVRSAAGDESLLAGDLVARLLIAPDPLAVHHVPHVAVTTRADLWRSGDPTRTDLLSGLLAERSNAPAERPSIEQGPFGTLMLRWPLPESLPKVSVIVPTRDRMDLLAVCVEGVLQRTDYPNIEVIVADNGSVEPETLAYLERKAADPRVKVVRWPHPYNYSAINNHAAAQASGDYLCLLNNDTEVIDPSWLRAMMAHAIRPGVGAVGARLLYPDRTIQHAGVVVGMGGAAGHAHRGLPEGEPGYFAQALVTRGATAVTAACLVVAREKFEAVDGLDADTLAIAYNDVDLCLKLRAAGWRNIYAAEAVLIHHEGKSRGLDFAPEHLARYLRELAAFQDRWNTVGFRDPLHHPALDMASEIYRLKV